VVSLLPFILNMRKFLLPTIIGLFLSISFISPAKATEQYYKDSSGFDYKYIEAYDLQNTNGDEGLYLKKLADLERASKATVHYDNTVKSHYMCDWDYNKVLGRWVCGKNYMKAYKFTHAEPIQACPFGYKLNYGRTGCLQIRVPTNAHLNFRGNGWECNPGFHVSLAGTSCLSDRYIYTQCENCAYVSTTAKAPCNTPPKPTCKTTSPYQKSCQSAFSTAYPIYQPQTITVKPIAYTNTVVKYVNADTQKQEIQYVNLAQTGLNITWVLLISILVSFGIWRMKKLIVG
jgi:hypothetical protein